MHRVSDAKVAMDSHYRTLISAAESLQHYQSPHWVMLDCRFDLADKAWGGQIYREGHVPGAQHADLERDLSGLVGGDSGRHPLPDWGLFADCLARWGVHRDSQVVVYDQGGGAYASRLWWMLRAVGHIRVALLDGGWNAWLTAGGGQSTQQAVAKAVSVELRPGSGWVTTGEVEANLDSHDFVLVDARSAERFAGRREPIDPVAGHIPYARNRPFEANLDADGLFRNPAALREDWLAFLAGVQSADVVHMCGSGVTACHNLLSMEAAGLGGSRLYVGSWSEWLRQDHRPVASGGD